MGERRQGRKWYAAVARGLSGHSCERVGANRQDHHRRTAATEGHTRRRPALCLTESSSDLTDDSD